MAASECSVPISRLQRFAETPELGDDGDGDDAVMVAQGVTCHWNGNRGKGAPESA